MGRSGGICQQVTVESFIHDTITIADALSGYQDMTGFWCTTALTIELIWPLESRPIALIRFQSEHGNGQINC